MEHGDRDIRASSATRPARILFLGLALGAAALSSQEPSGFFTITPCRLYDSRGGAGPLVGGFDRWVPVGSHCGIPPDATAAALNFTAVTPNAANTLSAYPTGVAPTGTTVVGFTSAVTRAGQAVLKTGSGGQISVLIPGPLSTQTDLVVDVSGYFRPSATVQQWRPWEQIITSTQDYTMNGGDPDADIDLRVRFTRTGTGTADWLVQGAYWDADDTAPRVFKISTALPAGNWTWQLESCLRGGVTNCLADGWAPTQGILFVQSNTASGNPLYDRGFPKQLETVVGSETTVSSKLVYPDGMIFQWMADTAWAAPPREYDPPSGQPQESSWAAFVLDRKAKGFTGVQIAPAVAWVPNPDDWWVNSPLPAATNFSFKNPTACKGLLKSYREHLKGMILQANEAGIVVAILGVMNPSGVPRASPYCPQDQATAFARAFARSMGSLAVIYSPSFDDIAEANGNEPGRRDLIHAVGRALRAGITGTTRKDILTNHLAGGIANCDTYRSFANIAPTTSRWLNYYFFQSGHGGTGSSPTAGPCPARVAGATDVQNAMRRAREMPLTLTGYTGPSLPAVNAEGPYDSQGTTGKQQPQRRQSIPPPSRRLPDRAVRRRGGHLRRRSAQSVGEPLQFLWPRLGEGHGPPEDPPVGPGPGRTARPDSESTI